MFNQPTRAGFSVFPAVLQNPTEEKMAAPNNAEYVLKTLHAGLPNAVLFSAEFNSAFSDKDTGDLTEGLNLYYTDERAQDAIGTILVDSSTIDFTYNDVIPSITAAVIPGGISHTAISDIGTNTHAQIDTHIAGTGTSVHGDSFLLNTGDTATGNYTFKADGTDFVIFDSTNKRVGINRTPEFYDLDVNGIIRAETGLRVGTDGTSDRSLIVYSDTVGAGAYISNYGNYCDIGTTKGTLVLKTTGANVPIVFTAGNAERARMLGSNGNLGLGLTAPAVKLHQDNGNATATYHKFTAGTTTGQTATDGFDVGIDASGNAELRQRENLPAYFYTNNSLRLTIASGGDATFTGIVQGAGYKSSDGTAGATANVAVAKVGGGTRTLIFKNGLYVGYADS